MNKTNERRDVLVTEVSWDTECHFEDCSTSFVTLTPKYAQLIGRRAQKLIDFWAEDPEVYELYCWDLRCQYTSSDLWEKVWKRYKIEGNCPEAALAPGNKLGELSHGRVECCQQVLKVDWIVTTADSIRTATDVEVSWLAIAKHSSTYLRTTPVPYSLLARKAKFCDFPKLKPRLLQRNWTKDD